MRNRNRHVTGWILIALITTGTIALAQKQTQTFVTVVAPSSGPLTNLTAKDFVVQGGKAEISDAERATEPLSIVILVDSARPPLNVNSPIEDIRNGLKAFVQTIRAGEPHARIALYQVAGASVPMSDMGAPASTLDKAVGMVAPGADMGGAVMVEGLQDASKKLAQEPAPRRTIVSIDFASADPFVDVQAGAVVKQISPTGASLFGIMVRKTEQEPNTGRENVFNSIIKNNGGLRITIGDPAGLRDQLQLVANSLLSQYELTIKGVEPTKVHDLKITTKDGAKVLPSLFAR
jgi:hypothetical protein